MLFDALTSSLGQLFSDTALSIVAIAAIYIGLVVVYIGALLVLRFIKGNDNAPAVGTLYREWDGGKWVMRSWSKKDQYMYVRSRGR